MLGSLGMPELIVIAVICLLIFGPKKLPGLAKGLGESIKEFKKAGKEMQSAIDEHHEKD